MDIADIKRRMAGAVSVLKGELAGLRTGRASVNLLDPTLLALEAVLIVVTFAWLYVGVVNYLFASRLGRQIKEARAKEKEIESKLT